jgi:hypothetical protein
MPLASTALSFDGHAIISADGMIADAEGLIPDALRVEADFKRFQAALDDAVLVVMGREGHKKHPNPGRRRLVFTAQVAALEPDPSDSHAYFYNPDGLSLAAMLAELGLTSGTVAVTGGTRVFDFFLPYYDRFLLSEVRTFTLPTGRPAFSGGHPRFVLAGAGFSPTDMETIAPGVVSTLWVKGRPAGLAGVC